MSFPRLTPGRLFGYCLNTKDKQIKRTQKQLNNISLLSHSHAPTKAYTSER
uniref:Uncharacterized protein n=1 Tax=Siphoviridae sp. ct5kv15 TaxID=2825338 RepID=A0A8S5PNL7_9CAUD|nr:MAG TPA: hypothetical protein [Siphoviridae sp. ct5kv15]